MCQSFFFLINLQAEAYNFIKKETLAQVFSCEVCEISKNIFFKEHLWATASLQKTYSRGRLRVSRDPVLVQVLCMF